MKASDGSSYVEESCLETVFFTILPPPPFILLPTPGSTVSCSTVPDARLLNEVCRTTVVPLLSPGLCVVGVFPGRFLPDVPANLAFSAEAFPPGPPPDSLLGAMLLVPPLGFLV